MIEQIVEYNKKFVENKGYEPYLTSKYPNKKLAVLTCMDTRLTELLPAALGLKNGDAKIIKNAGGVITHPYGSVVRSLLVAILEKVSGSCPNGLVPPVRSVYSALPRLLPPWAV